MRTGKDTLAVLAAEPCLNVLAAKFGTWVRDTPGWTTGLQTLPPVRAFSASAVKVRTRWAGIVIGDFGSGATRSKLQERSSCQC